MLVKQRIVLSLVFSLFIVSGYNAQNSSKNERDNPSTFLNLSFENASQSGQALCWYQWGDGFKVKVDTTVSHEGLKSMRIQKISSGQFGATSANFPINDAKGKHLRYTGYIKTKDITNGYAGLWWRVDGKIQGKILGFDNMAGRGATGTSDWKQYSIEMDIDTSAQNIVFGVIMPGNGTAWFDDLQLELDGKVYEQIEPKPFIPSNEQINWLKENVIPIKTSDPVDGEDDIIELKTIIGDARIVALGEGTHGTSEFFKMKHRIVKFLAENMGFTVFAIEANMPEARKVNDYILYGKGDPKEALSGLYFWTWNTQEVLDMIEWMRKFNASHKGRIEFWGFDMQFPHVAIKNVKQFVEKIEPQFIDTLAHLYNKVEEIYYAARTENKKDLSGTFYEPWYNNAKKVYNHLINKQDQFKQIADSKTIDQIIQDARIVFQAAETNMQGKTTRDESMALNVEWILSQFPTDAKIILWAHNGHITRGQEQNSVYQPMGKYLDNKYGKQMVTFGFSFGDGKYTAVGPNGLGIYETSLPQPGSYEYVFRKTGVRDFIFDLRKIYSSPLSNWLNSSLYFRSIGALAMDYAFYNTILPEEFDVIIYFDKTTPSKLLIKTNKE